MVFLTESVISSFPWKFSFAKSSYKFRWRCWPCWSCDGCLRICSWWSWIIWELIRCSEPFGIWGLLATTSFRRSTSAFNASFRAGHRIVKTQVNWLWQINNKVHSNIGKVGVTSTLTQCVQGEHTTWPTGLNITEVIVQNTDILQ